MIYLIQNGFLKKQKHSVCASIEVDVGVIMISAPVCKWFVQPGAHITFDAWLLIDCSSTTMERTPTLAINNVYNRSNSAFPMYRVPNKINCWPKFIQSPTSQSKLSLSTHSTLSCTNSIFTKSQANILKMLFVLQCYVLFFFLILFFKNNKKFDRSYDLAQKKKNEHGRQGPQ
ncbi:hypothetical protein RFI_40166 [Reticulomyxa filosa]|uniref:Uncharacterized protein n=1 Tax=Reticulomyxa filosa TaxID=46433 RepID=X6L9J7_RETFI|nr:hypothetical protein RFI_40166 [Reticulomyxa filosa]|eukprot:ETN97364.1 hypothetical protein RFI_40166 [Reticulomyxa filosa]